MAEHTKGPLTVMQCLEPEADAYGNCGIVDGSGAMIGEAFTKASIRSFADALANATLWAAAPDLLAACEAAHRALVGWAKDEANADMFPTALFTLNDAIAKARGAQP